MKLRALLALAPLLPLVAVACGDASSGSSSSSSARSAPPADAALATARDAFMMGRKYAFASSFEMLEQEEKKAKAYKEAAELAQALGVKAPTFFQTRESVAAELRSKHGERVAAAFLLGHNITFAWCGAELGADESSSLPEIAANAQAAGVPEAVWKARLEGLEPRPTPQGVDALEKELEAHFRR